MPNAYAEPLDLCAYLRHANGGRPRMGTMITMVCLDALDAVPNASWRL
jgi:hypothetical protein